MSKNKIYVDLHVLQTVPPSCVNRDDTGSPKTAVYGGVTRARVSSQAWKRAIRLDFQDSFPSEKLGLRTKHIVTLVAEEISRLEPARAADKAEKLAIEALKNAGLKIKDSAVGTDALFFISKAQIEALAKQAVDDIKNNTACKEALNSEPSIDLALFGRMVADDPSLNYDASAQVAHSISTHAVHNEYDYFTAVDDCSAEDNAGAGHIGTVEFNSSTLYRYATVNALELKKSIGSDAPHAIRCFAQSFVKSMPTGKQNTFANRTLPDDIYVVIRRDQPVNFAGAFESPVQKGLLGYMAASEKKMTEYACKIYVNYAGEPQESWAVGDAMGELTAVMPFDKLLDSLENALRGLLGDCEVQ